MEKKWPVPMNLHFFAVEACVPGGVRNQAEQKIEKCLPAGTGTKIYSSRKLVEIAPEIAMIRNSLKTFSALINERDFLSPLILGPSRIEPIPKDPP